MIIAKNTLLEKICPHALMRYPYTFEHVIAVMFLFSEIHGIFLELP